MDISIDTFIDEDLKKIDEMLYVDVNIIPIDFRVQHAISMPSIILQKWMHTCGDPTSFGPKLSKRDISFPVLCAYVEGRIYVCDEDIGVSKYVRSLFVIQGVLAFQFSFSY